MTMWSPSLIFLLVLEVNVALRANSVRIRGNRNRQNLSFNEGIKNIFQQREPVAQDTTVVQHSPVVQHTSSVQNTPVEHHTPFVEQKRKDVPLPTLPQRKRAKLCSNPKGKERLQPITEDDHESLNFTYDAKHALSKDEVQKIKDPVKRARACDPTAKREVLKSFGAAKQSEWVSTDETNAQYVARKMNMNREHGRKNYEMEKTQRTAQKRRTGITPVSKAVVRKQKRISRAGKGSPEEIMTFEYKGKTYNDPKGRRKGEYLQEFRQKHSQDQKRYMQRLTQSSDEASGPFIPRSQRGTQMDLNRLTQRDSK